jgi:hypothetical protein
LGVFGCVWLCLVVFVCVCVCLCVFGCVWVCLGVFGCVWVCLSVFECVRVWEWQVGVFLQSAIFASLECVARSVLHELEENCGVGVVPWRARSSGRLWQCCS